MPRDTQNIPRLDAHAQIEFGRIFRERLDVSQQNDLPADLDALIDALRDAERDSGDED